MNLNSSALSKPTTTALTSPRKGINLILTARSLFILLFVVYLFSFPISKESDIIATVIAVSLLALITTLSLITTLVGRAIRRKIVINVFPPEMIKNDKVTQDGCVVSNQPCVLIVKTSPIFIPALFHLRIRIDLYSDDLLISDFSITGNSKETRLLVDKIAFPHRGRWDVMRISCEFADKLLFTNYAWELEHNELQTSIRVCPPPIATSRLPIISSASRVGDTLPDLKERHGDPYDLKPYHPADGIRKVLWKIFAKSGELISRHPEASMTPEGQVVVFCLADKHDEFVCSTTLAYLTALEDLNLEIFFGCEGMGSANAATNYRDAREMLIESVWHTEMSTSNSIVSDISELFRQYSSAFPNTSLQKIIIFTSQQRIETPVGYQCALALASHISKLQITPVFCILERSFQNSATNDVDKSNDGRIVALLKRAIFKPDGTVDSKQDSHRYVHFLQICAQQDWHIILDNE